MISRKLKFTAAIILGAAVLSACWGRKGGDDNELVIGVIADRTGFMSGHGESTEMGASLAVQQLNEQSGVLGNKVKLVVLDGESDPATSASRARELIQRYDVDVLVGTGTSAATLSAIGAATEGKTPFIYSLDGEIKTCKPGDKTALNPYIFASGFSERMAVRPLLEFLISNESIDAENATIFFVGGDYVYPRTTNAYAKEVAESLGMTVIGEEYSDTATPDYAPLIRKIQQADPDILIVTNPGASGVTFMRQAQQFNLPDQMLISGFATFDQEAIAAMGNASESVFAINRYSNLLENSQNAAFVQAFHSKYPDKPLLPGPTAAAGSYGVVELIAAAAESAGAADRESLTAALPGLSASLPQGDVTIDRSNHMFNQPLYVMQIHNQAYEVVEAVSMRSHPGFDGCSVN